jgi:hypothetical protein
LFLDCICEFDTFKLFFDFANFTIKKTTGNNLAKLFFEETIEKKLKKNHATSWGEPFDIYCYGVYLQRFPGDLERHFKTDPTETVALCFRIPEKTLPEPI